MTRPGLEIAPAVETAQLEEIRRLAHDIWREHYPGIISVEQIEYMLRERNSLEALCADRDERGVRFELARLDDVPIGYVAYGPGEHEADLMLHSLYVRAEHRRTGLARRLLGRVTRHAASLGLRYVVLRVNKKNQVALAAYARFGFRTRAAIVTDIGQGFVMDDYLMEFDLQDLGHAPGVA